MSKNIILLFTFFMALHTGEVFAQENIPAKKPDAKQPVKTEEQNSTQKNDAANVEPENKGNQQHAAPAPEGEIVKQYPVEEVYFDIKLINFFNYGIGFEFGFDPVLYGFSGIIGYRHLNTFTGFPGQEGGTRAAMDLFIDAGIHIASVDGDSVVSGFAALTLACNILWFKPYDKGNYDRTGNGIFIGAKVEGSYSKDGFLAEYGPAIGWTMIHYNTEKKKFRTTNIALYYYPPTMTLGLSATTNF
ncbi:MAG TPA: hypothetical protein PK926_04715 [Spirochaetota bacterium]|nr:hypothetical protein [Spirochaetota bacterium]HPI88881.1 hypothetical protein [Spirochaetota bacterium]HPR46989.1 hypothetical protein [Spirochaetota bacterium]